MLKAYFVLTFYYAIYCTVQHHRILLSKYGAIEINKHYHTGRWPPRLPHPNYRRELTCFSAEMKLVRRVVAFIRASSSSEMRVWSWSRSSAQAVFDSIIISAAVDLLAATSFSARTRSVLSRSTWRHKTTPMTAMSGYFANALYPLYNVEKQFNCGCIL